MFENPVHKERAMGLAALAAIGLGGAMAVDTLVTGGFDFAPGRADPRHEHRGVYVQMADAADYVSDGISSMDWFSRAPDTSQSEERLAGADDGSATEVEMAGASSDGGARLYQEIAALYADSEAAYVDEPSYEDAPAIDAGDDYVDEPYEEPTYADEYEADETVSASENASPW